MGENKVIWITIIISVIGIIGVFGLLLALAPKNMTNEEKRATLIKDDSYIIGNKDAKVELVVFEDFQCPACGAYYPEFKKVEAKYPNDVKFVFRHFPLTEIHQNALEASEAAEAAGAQGKFKEYYDTLYSKQKEWSDLSGDDLMAKFKEYAKDAGVKDLTKFEQDIKNSAYAAKIQRDIQDGQKLNVNATPTAFLNNDQVSNPTFDYLDQAIGNLLKK